MLRILFSIFGVTAFLGGCAYQSQSVAIVPTVSVVASQAGNGREIALFVVDERPKRTLGIVGFGGSGADISIEGDLVASIQSALSNGLTRINFLPHASRGTAPTELRVEIRNLDYLLTQGFWVLTLRVDVSLKAVCVRGSNRPYEKLHHGEVVDTMQTSQTEEANSKYINNAVSATVNALLADKELIACLSQ